MTATLERSRGRPREFDVDVALAAMRRQFQEHGYHATSLAHLTAATGLHRGSLYAAFGNKHEMFLAVLRQSAADTLEAFDAAMAGARSPMAGLRKALREQARRAAADGAGGRGCLIANTTLELLPGDDAVARVIAGHQRDVIERFAAAIDAARAHGQIRSRRSSTCLARYLLTVVEGLWQLARTNPDSRVLTPVVEAAFDTLDR